MSTLISHEIPKALFPHQSLISDYPYALGHLLGKDKEYSEFYKYQFKNSQFGILDNSCFELGKSIDLKDLKSVVNEYVPSHYILPDQLHSQYETLQMSEEFLALHNSQLDSAPIGVVQGKSFNELIQCIQWYLDHHVRFIAIPFDPLPDSEFGITRYFFFKEIFDYYVKKNVGVRWHFLGCQNPSEFQLYSPEMKEFIYSVDTSSPIITGWNGIKYGDYGYSQGKPKEKLADSLDIELSYDQIQDIIYNVKKFKQYWK